MARPSLLAGLPKFTRGGFWLLVLAVGASASLADHPVAGQLLLNGRFTAELALWQPLSAVVLYPDGQLGGLIGTLVIQWFIGGRLEELWGTSRYLTYILGSAVLGYLAAGLLGFAVPAALAHPLGGTLPADIAAVVGIGVVYGRQQFQLFGALPISARGLAALAVALALFGPLVRGAWPTVIPTAVAALCALGLAWRWRTPPSSGKVATRAGKPRKNHLRVVKQEKLLN